MDLIGTPAPDFELSDHHGVAWRLSALRGQNVMVVFYPYAFTGVCTGELCAIRDELAPSLPAETQLLAISCDTKFALRVFAEQQGLNIPLLSDFWPHGEVASAYGVFDPERGCAIRGTFLIDRDGVVRWSVVNAIPHARDISDYRRALGELVAG
ncbi:peroxiredoxin [Phytoactinopolyspora halotolerans]|uniref:Alkyl hydroperoxide reductase E n=1 Tax=Phytoactinopolyspora halotolerans TaxID=1981512 RepID=A0A6L9S9M2_9ACTN|nr:peroxiredoxin [Phytoactinopolyspora halotolerans]NEE02075.1 peroxiredoxin [Phytoactinopolyspora halotolerans]